MSVSPYYVSYHPPTLMGVGVICLFAALDKDKVEREEQLTRMSKITLEVLGELVSSSNSQVLHEKLPRLIYRFVLNVDNMRDKSVPSQERYEMAKGKVEHMLANCGVQFTESNNN